MVHKELGPGLLETIYEVCLADVLLSWGFDVVRQKPFSVTFRGKILDTGFKTDLVINNNLIVELKSVEKIIPVHEAQMISYLRLSGIPLGLLINFNVPLLKQGIKRFVSTETRGVLGDRGVEKTLEESIK